MGRVRRALRRIEDAGGAGVMEGALSTMTEEDIEKFRMERDERHAKAANPRCVHGSPPTKGGHLWSHCPEGDYPIFLPALTPPCFLVSCSDIYVWECGKIWGGLRADGHGCEGILFLVGLIYSPFVRQPVTLL